jgi:DNA-binding GntR family transcriptional regulator
VALSDGELDILSHVGTRGSKWAGEILMNLKEKTITELRNSILKGEFGPGERLTEALLSARFQVSRTPIREALNQLEKEGFVKITPAAGARVVKLSLKDTFDIYDILIVLEGAASRLACPLIDKDQVNKLEEYQLLFEKALREGNEELLFDLNTQFHWLITEATKNSYLIEMRTNFRRLVDRIARIFPHVPGQCEETLLWHRKIIDALKARNPALAEFVMKEHLGDAKKKLAEYLEGREKQTPMPEGLLGDRSGPARKALARRAEKREANRWGFV